MRLVAGNVVFEISKVDKLVGLSTKLVSDHRWLGLQGGDDAHTLAHCLQRSDKAAKIPVA